MRHGALPDTGCLLLSPAAAVQELLRVANSPGEHLLQKKVPTERLCDTQGSCMLNGQSVVQALLNEGAGTFRRVGCIKACSQVGVPWPRYTASGCYQVNALLIFVVAAFKRIALTTKHPVE